MSQQEAFEVTAVKNVWIIFLLFVPGLDCR